ncbi:MAG: hypothetical protein FWE82_03705 [Defluviitaleaceae bacterium]|nr:hypothetical protein [Defluviitaleaceae bacterium]
MEKMGKMEKMEKFFTAVISIFLIAVLTACMFSIAASLYSFIYNQFKFTELYSEAAEAIACFAPKRTEEAKISIEYLERLQNVQRSAATNDIMAFLFSVLSATLVGLCAVFAGKGYKNVKKSKTAADNAKTAAVSAQAVVVNAEKAYKEAETLYTDKYEFLNNQLNVVKAIQNIQSIQTEIISAKSALTWLDQTAANRIYFLPLMVNKLSSDTDHGMIRKLQEELLRLKTAVEVFKTNAEGKAEGEKISMFQAVDNYNDWIDKAVGKCADILNLP